MNKLNHFKYESNINNKFKITQIFCSAINFRHRDGTERDEKSVDILAKAILTAQYEATLWIAVLNAIKTKCNAVYLTMVGGGVFNNDQEWIIESMKKAILTIQDIRFPLNVYIIHNKNIKEVSYYDLENLSYDFDRNRYIYYDNSMQELDNPDLEISFNEMYKIIDKIISC